MKDFLRRFMGNPISVIGFVIVFGFIVLAISAPWICSPFWENEPYRIPRDGFSVTPKPPTPKHPLGTTQGQYDILYGVVWGTRTAFRVGIIVTGSACFIGLLLGSIAGYFGGLIDEVIMRVTDVFMAVPFIVAAMVLTAVLGKGLDKVMIAMVVFSWMSYARLIRGDILAVKEQDYIAAARGIGAGHTRIIVQHILPNAIFSVLIQTTMQIGTIVIWASALSFLGLGAPEGYADWGQLISFSRNWIIGTDSPLQYWFTIFYPSIAMVLFVLGWNLVGDAFRDVLDPRMRRVAT